jgi:hypothetical protein
MSNATSTIHVRFINIGSNAQSWDAEISGWSEAGIAEELRKKHAWPERGARICMGLLEAELRNQKGRLLGTVERKYASGGNG